MNAFGSVPLPELRKKLNNANERLAVAALAMQPIQAEISALNEAIHNSLLDTAKKAFLAGNKSAGDVTMTVDGAGKFKASISKTVKWDSAKLQGIAAGMSWNEANSVFKIDFSVSEANYKAAQTMKPELAEKLLAARSVKYGDLRIVAIED